MDTEVEELALLALIIRRRRKRRKKERKMWVRKLYQTREQMGAFPPLANFVQISFPSLRWFKCK